MRDHAWWESAVIYQIYPRSFMDSTGTGVGDLPGITSRLDYVADLGVDALWISPFYISPMRDFGYDVADYTDVDPLFGTLADFDSLLAEAHFRGLKVIVDMVPNHTSDEHPWFIESRSSRSNPKRDWYVWRDRQPDGSPPNNWLAAFGGGAWEWDDHTQQYYLHLFLKEQPDLNWRNPEVEEAFFDNYRFWLDRGVDGFRIDVADRIMKDPALRDNPPNPRAGDSPFKDLGEYEGQLHLHDMRHPDLHDVYRRLRSIIDSYHPPRVTIGEIHEFNHERAARYFGDRLDELHLPFNFHLLYVSWNAEAVRRSVDEYATSLPDGAWPNYVLGNHDEARLATRFGPERARAGAVLLLTLRGTPTLYYGDELGMQQVDIPPEDQQDPWAVREPTLGRDGARTPMQWDGSASAGFSTAPPDRLWLPLTPDHTQTNVAAQSADPTSILTLYRRLLSLRRGSPALTRGSYEPLEAVPTDVFAYYRSAGDERMLIAINFSSDSVRFNDEALHGAQPLVSSELRTPSLSGTSLELSPNEAVLLRV